MGKVPIWGSSSLILYLLLHILRKLQPYLGWMLEGGCVCATLDFWYVEYTEN